MSNISKHDANEKPKGDNIKNSRVELSIAWHSISIKNFLRILHNIRRINLSGWRFGRVFRDEGYLWMTIRLNFERKFVFGDIYMEMDEMLGNTETTKLPVNLFLLFQISL